MRIIYVEDNIANVHLVKRVARMGKHEIINYIDGMDAFNNFETDQADLVLMDIQLAGELTGIEVVKKLREKGFTTPIIAVTAYAMVGDKERCMEAGCTGYMAKPIPIPELVKLFQKYDKPKPPADTQQTGKQVSESSESVAQSPPETVVTKTPTPTANTEQNNNLSEKKPSPETVVTNTSTSTANTEQNNDLSEKKPAPETVASTPKTTAEQNTGLPEAKSLKTSVDMQKNQVSAEGDDKLTEEDSTPNIAKLDKGKNVPKSVNKDKPAEMT